VTVQTLRTERGPRVDKFAERRAELAWAAVKTLAELGYARTSLREIAQNSEFSHGVLHYYFKDKADLITCCVRTYKSHCVTRYDQVTAEATSAEQLLDGFVDGLAASVQEEAHLHRLWYDLRAQALFEPAFRADVAEIDKSLESMIWRIMSRFAELTGRLQTLPPALLYSLFDGLFQQCLLKHLAGEASAIPEMREHVRALLARICFPEAVVRRRRAPRETNQPSTAASPPSARSVTRSTTVS
jgi:AcrR family transcriptional regulator